MVELESRYQVSPNNPFEKELHSTRRMFCIVNGDLKIADESNNESHVAWFNQEGWISPENDRQMDQIIRGAYYPTYPGHPDGVICFYVGYDFRLPYDCETCFFEFLPQLIKRLNLTGNECIWGGLIKQEGKAWTPRKSYGTVRALTFNV